MLNVGEASAVNTLLRHLLGAIKRGTSKPPSRKEAIEALGLLADGAHRKLGAGFSGDSARELLPVLWTTPPVPPQQVWWLDDGQENPGPPDLYTTEDAAHTAAVDAWKTANPFTEITNLEWLFVDSSAGDPHADTELNINHQDTGHVVRPVRPKDGA